MKNTWKLYKFKLHHFKTHLQLKYDVFSSAYYSRTFKFLSTPISFNQSVYKATEIRILFHLAKNTIVFYCTVHFTINLPGSFNIY